MNDSRAQRAHMGTGEPTLVDLEAIAQEATDRYESACAEDADQITIDRLAEELDDATETYLAALQADMTDEALAIQIDTAERAADIAPPSPMEPAEGDDFPF